MSTVQLETLQLDTSTAAAGKRRRPLLAGVVVSLCLHAFVGALLIVVPYLVWLWLLSKSVISEPQITIVASVDEEESPEPPPRPAVEVTAEIRPAEEVTVEEMVNRSIERAEQRPEDESLDEFARQARRLEEISDAESIEAMAGKFHSWLGTEERATQPAEQPVAGKFDFDSAQIHDVRREQREDGTWRYICVLVDAEGRSLETELDDVEGEQQYKTFQQLKKFPLADKVYREIAMPLLDKILQEQE